MLVWSLLAIVMLGAITPLAQAFGIKPAQQSLTFQPGLEFTGQFVIVRDTDTPSTARLRADGDLAKYISFDGSTVQLSGTETSIRYTIKLPQALPPGQSVGKILVEESPEGDEGISAKIAITFKIYVNNPLPQKRITVTFHVVPGPENVEAVVTATNDGTVDLAAVVPRVSLTRSGVHVATRELPGKALPVGATERFLGTIPAGELRPGLYAATADVAYDGSSLRLDTNFSLGAPVVAVLEKETFFKAGEINAFNFEVQNKWNAPLTGVTASFTLSSGSTVLSSFTTEAFTLAADEQKRITSHFDARGIAPGTYDASLRFTSDAGSATDAFRVELFQAEQYEKKAAATRTASPVALLILVAILFFNILLIAYLIVRLVRRRSGKR